MTVQNLNPIYSACVRFIAGTKGILVIIYLFYAVSTQPTHCDAIVWFPSTFSYPSAENTWINSRSCGSGRPRDVDAFYRFKFYPLCNRLQHSHENVHVISQKTFVWVHDQTVVKLTHCDAYSVLKECLRVHVKDQDICARWSFCCISSTQSLKLNRPLAQCTRFNMTPWIWW